MSRKAIIISLLAMFLSGAAFGVMGGILFAHHMHERMMGMGGGPGGPGGRHIGMRYAWGFGGPDDENRGGIRIVHRQGGEPLEDVLPHLTRMLELTPEQVARIEPKVRDTRGQFAAVRESLHSRIESELTPEQIERWRELRRHMPNPGEPRGPWRRANGATPGPEGEPK
jgi:hypothetical protein